MSGRGAIAGFEFQDSVATLLCLAAMLDAPLSWFQYGGLPLRVRALCCENGGDAEDISVTTKSDEKIEVQAKRGLQLDDRFRTAMRASLTLLAANPSAYVAYAVDDTASKPVREDLRHDLTDFRAGKKSIMGPGIELLRGLCKELGLSEELLRRLSIAKFPDERDWITSVLAFATAQAKFAKVESGDQLVVAVKGIVRDCAIHGIEITTDLLGPRLAEMGLFPPTITTDTSVLSKRKVSRPRKGADEAVLVSVKVLKAHEDGELGRVRKLLDSKAVRVISSSKTIPGELLLSIAKCLVDADMIKQAKQILAAKPECIRTGEDLEWLAQSFLMGGEQEWLLALLDKVNMRNTHDTQLSWIKLGCLQALGLFSEAYRQLTYMLEATPGNPQIYMNYLQSLVSQNLGRPIRERVDLSRIPQPDLAESAEAGAMIAELISETGFSYEGAEYAQGIYKKFPKTKAAHWAVIRTAMLNTHAIDYPDPMTVLSGSRVVIKYGKREHSIFLNPFAVDERLTPLMGKRVGQYIKLHSDEMRGKIVRVVDPILSTAQYLMNSWSDEWQDDQRLQAFPMREDHLEEDIQTMTKIVKDAGDRDAEALALHDTHQAPLGTLCLLTGKEYAAVLAGLWRRRGSIWTNFEQPLEYKSMASSVAEMVISPSVIATLIVARFLWILEALPGVLCTTPGIYNELNHQLRTFNGKPPSHFIGAHAGRVETSEIDEAEAIADHQKLLGMRDFLLRSSKELGWLGMRIFSDKVLSKLARVVPEDDIAAISAASRFNLPLWTDDPRAVQIFSEVTGKTVKTISSRSLVYLLREMDLITEKGSSDAISRLLLLGYRNMNPTLGDIVDALEVCGWGVGSIDFEKIMRCISVEESNPSVGIGQLWYVITQVRDRAGESELHGFLIRLLALIATWPNGEKVLNTLDQISRKEAREELAFRSIWIEGWTKAMKLARGRNHERTGGIVLAKSILWTP